MSTMKRPDDRSGHNGGVRRDFRPPDGLHHNGSPVRQRHGAPRAASTGRPRFAAAIR